MKQELNNAEPDRAFPGSLREVREGGHTNHVNHDNHNQHVMRDSKTTRFTKAVVISEEHYNYLLKTKHKKSIAGRLEEIINEYDKTKVTDVKG